MFYVCVHQSRQHQKVCEGVLVIVFLSLGFLLSQIRPRWSLVLGALGCLALDKFIFVTVKQFIKFDFTMYSGKGQMMQMTPFNSNSNFQGAGIAWKKFDINNLIGEGMNERSLAEARYVLCDDEGDALPMEEKYATVLALALDLDFNGIQELAKNKGMVCGYFLTGGSMHESAQDFVGNLMQVVSVDMTDVQRNDLLRTISNGNLRRQVRPRRVLVHLKEKGAIHQQRAFGRYMDRANKFGGGEKMNVHVPRNVFTQSHEDLHDMFEAMDIDDGREHKRVGDP